jgi:hypothetical protein
LRIRRAEFVVRRTTIEQNRRRKHRRKTKTNQRCQRDAGAAQTPAQIDFFRSTNAAAVNSVVDATASQVEHLLPRSVSKSGRTRVAGEIYRELDTRLRGNRALRQQLRDRFRSGALAAEHQRAIVSLFTGQALPGDEACNWPAVEKMTGANDPRRTGTETSAKEKRHCGCRADQCRAHGVV